MQSHLKLSQFLKIKYTDGSFFSIHGIYDSAQEKHDVIDL